MKKVIYSTNVKSVILERATRNNPNKECSIIKDTLFIGDDIIEISDYVANYTNF